MARVSSTWEGGKIVFRDYGEFAVWFDTTANVPVLTVHWIFEHKFKNRLSTRPEFAPDSLLPSENQVAHDTYNQAGQGSNGPFDRGHLVPMNDLNSPVAEMNTFRTTNIAPQQSYFNQKTWGDRGVEGEIRELVAGQTPGKNDKALVFTGVIHFQEDQVWLPVEPKPGEPRVLVPGAFFKVVMLCGNDDEVDSAKVWFFIQDATTNSRRDPAREDIKKIETLGGFDLLVAPKSP